jgi:hypothetical protein
MTQNTSFELTREEVLEALTQAINREYRYSGYMQPGQALSCEWATDGSVMRVQWGRDPELDRIKPAPVPATLEPSLMES